MSEYLFLRDTCQSGTSTHEVWVTDFRRSSFLSTPDARNVAASPYPYTRARV